MLEIVAVDVASLNRQPDKLNAVADTFFSSMYSALGRPTTGEGSAMISVMTTAKRDAVCAEAAVEVNSKSRSKPALVMH